MLSVGEKLRHARLEQAREIAEMASATKISPKFLEAIEADRRDRIPATFFFRSWALQYAHALSLDEKEIQEAIDRVLSADAPLPLPGQAYAASKELPSINRNAYRAGGIPRMLLSFSLLVLVIVGCSGLYAWWHKQQQDRQNVPIQSAKDPATQPEGSRVKRDRQSHDPVRF